MQSLPESLNSRLAKFDQQHLVRHWDELNAEDRADLIAQIEAVDFERLAELAGHSAETDTTRADRAQAPATVVSLPASDADNEKWEEAEQLGNEALSAGRVGVILVAGGQGTRLGFPHPKGMYPIGPVSGNPLFQLLVHQVCARAKRAEKSIPYYVMTSDATHAETVAFFKDNDNFGLQADKVSFFRQGNMPAVDAPTGKVLLADKCSLAVSPDGHGGMLQALASAGLLEQMKNDGIDLLYYHQVDNPTAIVCDPALIGFHLMHETEMSTKVVRKVSPSERMGVVVDLDGSSQIIEYSELSDEQSAKEDANGQWIFWAGNTAIHMFNRDFLDRIVATDSGLPFHLAKKNVPFIDESGVAQKPDNPANPNAIKFERFIFDAMPKAKNALVVEASREREFNPVKNREGNDSPETAKAAIARIGRDWLTQAGQNVADDAIVEISPLVALSAADVEKQGDDQLTGSVFMNAE